MIELDLAVSDAMRNRWNACVRLHRLSHGPFFKLIGPTTPKLPRNAFKPVPSGLDPKEFLARELGADIEAHRL